VKGNSEVKLNLEQIRTDGGTQPRATLRSDVIEDYAEQMRAGEDFDPVDVFFDGTHYWLAGPPGSRSGSRRWSQSPKSRPLRRGGSS
jgi:hypothetical protein